MKRITTTIIALLAVFAPSSGGAQGVDHAEYDVVLSAHVSGRGVDYARLKADRGALDRYVARLAAVSQQQFDAWNRAEKLAYLINAYNAVVLQSVIDNYPIRRSFNPTALVHPANSIWQIPGFFGEAKHRVAGRDVTLDDIEHKLLRAALKEPRIHAALVCAARSCPPLRGEPYVGDRIEAQLDDQARAFLSDPTRNMFDRAHGEVKLSEIFKWFGEDFGEKDKGVIAFVSHYVDAATQKWLHDGKYRISYFDYDWNLNDAAVR